MRRAWEPMPLLAPAAGARIAGLLVTEEPDADQTRGARRRALACGGIFVGILAFGLHADPHSGFLAAPADVPPARFEARSEESDMTAIRIPLAVATAAALSVAAASPAEDAVLWRVEDGGNGHWYRVVVVPGGVTWTTARQQAETHGGRLACLESDAERDYCFDRFTPASHPSAWIAQAGPFQGGPVFGPWIGAKQEAGAAEPLGGWSWLTGSTFNPAAAACCNNLCNGLSNEDKLHLWKSDQLSSTTSWNDLPDIVTCGSQPISYLVEYDADCNGDGIVDYGQCRDGSLPDYDGNNIPDCCEAGVACTVGNYPVQWRVEAGGNGHWYASALFTDGAEGITWSDARSYARGRGGDLTSLETQSELEWVYERLASKPSLWWFNSGENDGPYLGGLQDSGMPGFGEPSGGWRWLTGVPLTVGSWGKGAPDNAGGQDFLHFWVPGPGRAMTFDDVADVDVGGSRSLIVEWSADCNGDGIVDYGQVLLGQLVDADSNGIPDVCEIDPCPGDVNETGAVNATDLAIVLGAWGTDSQKFPRADTNRDGTVDALDLAQVLSDWGPCP